MAFNSNGQIQYLVLDSLAHGSKYGLEIIEFISQKTGGNYIMKKPTLYSCLTRMEKKGLVSSSYWGESEFGGKRHYYTITNQGKQTLEQLSNEFEGMNFVDQDDDSKAPTQPMQTVAEKEVISNQNQIENSQTEDSKPIFLQQDNIFDIVNKSSTESQPATIQSSTEADEEADDVIKNQMDFFSYTPDTIENETIEEQGSTQENEEENAETEEIKNDAIFIENEPASSTNSNPDENASHYEKMQYYQSILESTQQPQPEHEELIEEKKDDAILLEHSELTPYQQAQNKRLYDTSTELKKYRNKKSFSENQIEMSVVYENAEDKEIQKARIEQLKKSMLEARQNGFEPSASQTTNDSTEQSNFAPQFEQTYFYKKDDETNTAPTPVQDAAETIEEERKDDAKFITEPRIDPNQMPIQKRITPPNIEVNIYDDNLPAPKRDSNLEPTYKDMMAKLFERKKEKSKEQPATSFVQPAEEVSANIENFADYDSLKKYYRGHGIEFKEYKKTVIERKHNTNFLNFITSTILLLLSGVGCGVLYAILNAANLIKSGTVFMYYTLPILFLVYCVYTFVKYKVYPSRKAVLIYNGIINWGIFVISLIVVFVINILCGMQYETMAQYLTSILIPALGLLIAFPINYYIKKFTYKKFSK